jgi:hypothetical protein
MPTDKPLPDADGIIDLTDLVEEDRSGATPVGEDSPVDMSFEQELDDLFGDVEPEPKKNPAPTLPKADETDLIDLEGMDLVDEATEPVPAPAVAAEADDVVELTGLAFEEPPVQIPPTLDTDADFPELSALLSEEEPALPELDPATAAPEHPVDELPEESSPAAANAPISLEEMDITSLEPRPEGLSTQAGMDALLGDLPEMTVAAAPADEEAVDISDLPELPPLVETPVPAAPTPAAAPASAAAAARAIDLDALDQIIKTATGPAPESEPLPDAEALAGLAGRLDALEAATATVADHLQALLALPDAEALTARMEQILETRLDALRAELPSPVPEPEAAGQALSALRAELLTAIEMAKPDETARIEGLRAALAPDFDTLRQGLPQPDQWVSKADLTEAMAATKAELLAAIEADKADPSALMHEFSDLLESRLGELRRELPGPEAFVTPQGLEQALRELRESLSRDLGAVLETAKQTARDEAKAVADALTPRLDALEADHVDPQALAEQVRQAVLPDLPDLDAALEAAKQAAKDEAKALGDALTPRLDALEAAHVDPQDLTERVRQTLMAAIPDVPSALTGLRESLSRDLSAVLETAKQASKEAADAMGQSLSQRILPLENGRVDPRILETLVKTEDFQEALATLRAEIAEDIIRRVPQAAAAVIREEIAVLAKELE